MKNNLRHLVFVLVILAAHPKSHAQCFEIESILVDACGGQEGLNEMVRFKVGNAPLNMASLTVSWPNNSWQGVIQNATTAALTAALNADILSAGGCGAIIQPPGGIIPANATAILVTSYNLDTAANSFGALNQDIYIVFQNNGTTSTGHFANSGTGVRILSMSFGACSDTVSYNRSQLTGGNGATVNYSNSGNATYTNSGCVAPVSPFIVDAGAVTNACPGQTISLAGTAQGQQAIAWSAPSGTFSAPNSLSTNYTVSAAVSGTVALTLTATNSCGVNITDTVILSVANAATANFPAALAICSGDTVPTLSGVSPNGISGTWNPATINNTANGSYIFTPNAGQCATGTTLSVTVSQSLTANFPAALAICSGDTVPTLSGVSPNGISGTWNPATINNTANGSYIFTPNAGQCAAGTTLSVTVSQSLTANFPAALAICSGDIVPTLSSVSPNGISGTWNPATINNTANGSYIFTPNAGQCATGTTLSVTVSQSLTANFPAALAICSGDIVPTLSSVSPNGISGTWNPATINNTANGSYIFTPNAGQCATGTTLSVTVNMPSTPAVMFSYPTPVCANSNPIMPTAAAGFTTGGNYTAPGLAIDATTGEVNIAASLPGTYPIIYTISANSSLCRSGASFSFTITIDPASIPNAISGSAAVCIGSTAQLSNTALSGIWTSSNNAVATVDSAGLVAGLAPGQATIAYSLNGNCPASVSKTITVYPVPEPVLIDGFLCVDNTTGSVISTVLLNSGLSNAQYGFSWTLDGNPLPAISGSLMAGEAGIYEVTATNLISGCTATASAVVGTSSLAVANAAVGQDFNDSQIITIAVTGGSGNYQFQLNDAPFQDSNTFTNITQGEYNIVVKDKNGCGILPLTVYALNYPHYFTPNGDGFHDTWNIKGLSEQNALIYIFDRYGKLLKAIKPSENSGWDGTYNNRPMPSTDYWFKLMYHNSSNQPKEFSAHFSLKR